MNDTKNIVPVWNVLLGIEPIKAVDQEKSKGG